MTTTAASLAPLHADMTAWRRDFHAHPELGFQETRTAGRVAALLEAAGITVTRGIGRTGLVGTLRAFSRETMQAIEKHLPRVAEGTAAAICSDLVGAGQVDRNPPLIMASEDFSFMLEKVPGCYLNIGNGLEEGGCEARNPVYDFNDQALPLGAAFFVPAVEAKLAAG